MTYTDDNDWAEDEYVYAFCPNVDGEYHHVADDGTAISQAYIDGVEPLGGQCRVCGTPDEYEIKPEPLSGYSGVCKHCGSAYSIELREADLTVF